MEAFPDCEAAVPELERELERDGPALGVRDEPAPPAVDADAALSPSSALTSPTDAAALLPSPLHAAAAAAADAATAAASAASVATTADAAAPTASAPPPIAALRNVHKTYLLGVEGVAALRGVSLTIAVGEFVVVLGKSGGGKTTLLNILGTIDSPTRGELDLCGARVDARTPDSTLAAIRLSRLGFVFQTFNLVPSLTALENVQLPMVLAGAPAAAAARELRAATMLARVGMAERLDHFPSQLSGGEQQRVTIARALANRPRLMLLDEPTGDLDSHNGNIVMRILTDLCREGVACVMVTHDVALKCFAHRVVHMLDGRVARIEDVPAFVREEALQALASSPSVRAWDTVQRRRHGLGQDGEDEGPDPAVVELLRRRREALAAAEAASFQGRMRAAASRVTVAGAGRILRALGLANAGESAAAVLRRVHGRVRAALRGYISQLTDEGPDVEAAPVAAEASSASASSASATDVRVVVAATAADAVAASAHAGTSTGLAGVAAISHALFTEQLGGVTAEARDVGSCDAALSAPVPAPARMVVSARTPASYATHAFALRARALAEAAAAAQEARQGQREAALHLRVHAAAEARRAREQARETAK